MPKKPGDSLVAAVKRLQELGRLLLVSGVVPSDFAKTHGISRKTVLRDLQVLKELGRPAREEKMWSARVAREVTAWTYPGWLLDKVGSLFNHQSPRPPA
jgi:hypothetical protein